MKALQNLIPNSNKVIPPLKQRCLSGTKKKKNSNICLIFVPAIQTDKASMLDEAIEYLKQLQLQVQVCIPARFNIN